MNKETKIHEIENMITQHFDGDIWSTPYNLTNLKDKPWNEIQEIHGGLKHMIDIQRKLAGRSERKAK